MKFISEDIDFYVLSRCTTSSDINNILHGLTISLFSGDMPYQYSQGVYFLPELDQYNVRSLTVLSNKFLDTYPNEYHEIKELYEKNKIEFFSFAKEYILFDIGRIKSGISRIEDYIEKNHIIARRKETILTILKHFKNEDFISVVNMLPMQIEGIFHDICIEVGINESTLDICSINQKLKLLQPHVLHFIYFEYYSFKFPIIRNVVAHGKLIEDNIEQTAIMLMLDLLPVCDLTMSDNMPIIKKIKLLDESSQDNFASLIEYFDYRDTKIPDFYKLNTKVECVEKKYNINEFWEYLKSEVKKGKADAVNNTKIMKFIKKLHGSEICIERSDSFFKALPDLIKEMKKAELELEKKLESMFGIKKNK